MGDKNKNQNPGKAPLAPKGAVQPLTNQPTTLPAQTATGEEASAPAYPTIDFENNTGKDRKNRNFKVDGEKINDLNDQFQSIDLTGLKIKILNGYEFDSNAIRVALYMKVSRDPLLALHIAIGLSWKGFFSSMKKYDLEYGDLTIDIPKHFLGTKANINIKVDELTYKRVIRAFDPEISAYWSTRAAAAPMANGHAEFLPLAPWHAGEFGLTAAKDVVGHFILFLAFLMNKRIRKPWIMYGLIEGNCENRLRSLGLPQTEIIAWVVTLNDFRGGRKNEMTHVFEATPTMLIEMSTGFVTNMSGFENKDKEKKLLGQYRRIRRTIDEETSVGSKKFMDKMAKKKAKKDKKGGKKKKGSKSKTTKNPNNNNEEEEEESEESDESESEEESGEENA